MTENSSTLLSPGIEVRLKNNPGRIGVLTNKPPVQRGGKLLYQVLFPEGKSYQPEHELELVEDKSLNMNELLLERKFGCASDLRRHLTHIHLSGRLVDLVYSMGTTHTDFYAYQYKPVLAFLNSPSKGILIADEVGLGKTIEAGLIWTELRARFDARRLLVVCPAMLCQKWCDELNQRFGISAKVMNAGEVLQHLQQSSDPRRIPDGTAVVCSMQGLRPRRAHNGQYGGAAKLAEFLESHAGEMPLIDLVIVDEAHHMRNPNTRNARLGRLLRDVTDHLLLLSATPVNLASDDLFHLLNLVDPDSFQYQWMFNEIVEANHLLQVTRDLILRQDTGIDEIKKSLQQAKQHILLRNNRQLEDLMSSDLLAGLLASETDRRQLVDRIEKTNLFRHVISRTRKVDVTERRVIREPVSHFVPMSAAGFEPDFYQLVSDAIRNYAEKHEIKEKFLLSGPQRQISSCMYAAAMSWQAKQKHFASQMYEDFGYEEDGADQSPLIDHLCDMVLPNIDIHALYEHDSKYEKLRELVRGHLSNNTKDKLIVFSYFRNTLFYLKDRLSKDGIDSQVLVGGMEEPKHEVIARFRDTNGLSVLLSSEVASEGVDLQFSRVLINYDLPWNPMKIEQRIGRLDRIGQQAEKISIINLMFAETIDQQIYSRLYERLRIFERTLGGMEAILGEEILKLTSDLLIDRLSPAQEQRRIDQTREAIEKNRQYQIELEGEAAGLIAHGGFILREIQAARDMNRRITEKDLRAYVEDYLKKYCVGFDLRKDAEDEQSFSLRLPAKTAASLKIYTENNKLADQTRLTSGDLVPCRFRNRVKDLFSSRENISQFHPLIKFIGADLKEKGENFYPLVAIQTDNLDDFLAGTYAFVARLWLFDGMKRIEDLSVRAIDIHRKELLDKDRSWQLLDTARIAGRDWLEAKALFSDDCDIKALQGAIEQCDSALDEDFALEKRQRDNENIDLVNFQTSAADRQKHRQIDVLREQIHKYRQTGRLQMIPANEGKIRKISDRFDVQTEILKHKSSLGTEQKDVCSGMILVSGHKTFH